MDADLDVPGLSALLRTCGTCQRQFYKQSLSQRFCSATCRTAHGNAEDTGALRLGREAMAKQKQRRERVKVEG